MLLAEALVYICFFMYVLYYAEMIQHSIKHKQNNCQDYCTLSVTIHAKVSMHTQNSLEITINVHRMPLRW